MAFLGRGLPRACAPAREAGPERPEVHGPPWGLGPARPLRLELRAHEWLALGGSPAEVVRAGEVVLGWEAAAEGRGELTVAVERYALRVEGAPDGARELRLGPEGVLSRGPEGGLALGPDDATPSGLRVRELLGRPLAGVIVDGRGRALGTPWRSRDPILAQVDLLEWVLLALPVLPGGGETSWKANRPVPPLGRYRTGIELELRYVALAPDAGTGPAPAERTVRWSGRALRERFGFAEGYAGRLELDARGEARLDPESRPELARVELAVRFRPERGEPVESLARLELRRADGGAESPARGSAAPRPPGQSAGAGAR